MVILYWRCEKWHLPRTFVLKIYPVCMETLHISCSWGKECESKANIFLPVLQPRVGALSSRREVHVWLFVFCFLWQRNSHLNRCALFKPLQASGLAAVSLCSVLTSSSVCISSAIVLRRAGAGDCSIWWLLPIYAGRYQGKDAGLPVSLGFKIEAPAFCFLKKDLGCGCKEKLLLLRCGAEERRGGERRIWQLG